MESIGMLISAIGIASLWGVSAWASRKKLRLSGLSWSGILLTVALSLFTLAWCLSSLWEKESRAAVVGLLIFGSLSLISMGLTRRIIGRDLKKTRKEPRG